MISSRTPPAATRLISSLMRISSGPMWLMQLFNNWGVGSSKSNNGVLLLLATAENKYYVEYGTGLTGTTFETDVGGKMSKFESYFDAGEYDKAVSYIFGEMMDWFDNEYGAAVASSGNSSGNYNDGGSQYSSGSNVFNFGGIFSLLIRLFVIYFFLAAIFRSFRRSYYTRTGSWLPLFLLFGPRIPYWGFRPGSHYDPNHFNDWNDHNHHEKAVLPVAGVPGDAENADPGQMLGDLLRLFHAPADLGREVFRRARLAQAGGDSHIGLVVREDAGQAIVFRGVFIDLVDQSGEAPYHLAQLDDLRSQFCHFQRLPFRYMVFYYSLKNICSAPLRIATSIIIQFNPCGPPAPASA